MVTGDSLLDNGFHKLAGDEEMTLILKAQKGDIEARNRIIESFIPLIKGIAKAFSTRSLIERDD